MPTPGVEQGVRSLAWKMTVTKIYLDPVICSSWMVETKRSSKKYVLGLFIDFTGEFDNTSWTIILRRLVELGIRYIGLWSSYFRERSYLIWTHTVGNKRCESRVPARLDLWTHYLEFPHEHSSEKFLRPGGHLHSLRRRFANINWGGPWV